MKIMLKSVSQYLLRAAGYLILLLALIFPLVNFKISASSAIFPSIDVIIIYYCVCYHRVGMMRILLISPFIDQLYGFSLGCNALALITGQLGLKVVGKWFLVKEYFSNILLFCCYCLIIFSVRYLIFIINEASYPSMFEIIFQYLTSIFSYPLAKALLDRMYLLFNFKAKNA